MIEMITPLGTIVKKYEAKGHLQQYRLEQLVSFTCSRCLQSKKSKVIAVCDDNWNKCLCNGCYGFLISRINEDEEIGVNEMIY